MKRLKIHYSIIILLAFISIISVGFASWTISEICESASTTTNEINAFSIKDVSDFVNLNTSENNGDAIENIYYTSDGFTQSNSTFDKTKVSLMSYYVLDTTGFTFGTYITINYQYSDVLGDLLSSNAYYIKAVLYDSNKVQVGDDVLKQEPNVAVTIKSTDGQGFGTNFYIAIELNIQQIQDFDTNWLTKLNADSVKLGISATVASDSESYWMLAFNANIGSSETEYVDINWDYSSAFTYNSTAQKVSLNTADYSMSVKYTDNQKTDAGNYTATATLSYGKKYIVRVDSEMVANGGTSSQAWQINPKTISLTDNLAISSSNSIDFSGFRDWSKFKALVKPVFGEDTLADTDYNLYGISDGTYLYADSDKSSTVKNKLSSLGYSSFVTKYTYVPGSTYIGYIEITSGNYVLEGQDYIYIKYKTAMIDSTYYTIEDAINDTSTTSSITMVGNPTTTEAEVQITAFSKLLETKTHTNSNHNLIVPFESLSTSETYTEIKALTVADADKKTCGCLYIPNGITYNTTKPFYITSSIAGSSICGAHGVVINDGTMNFNSNSSDSSSLYSYGYLKGLGNIIVSSGVTVTDVMKFGDFAGGNVLLNLYGNCFPFFVWELNNISCKTIYKYGSELKCFASLYSQEYKTLYTAEAVLIGTSNETENCLFTPSSTASTQDYIEKYTDSIECNTLFTYDNQIKVISDINLSGSYEDRNVALTAMGLKYSTDYNEPLPISYINVNVLSGSLNISKGSYFFLQGTRCNVFEGAELSINGDSYFIFDKTGDDALVSYFDKDYAYENSDAILEVNGTLSGTGSVYGTIESSTEGAILQIDNYSVKKKRACYKTSKTEYAKNQSEIYSQYKKYYFDTLSVDSEYSTITKGEYKSTYVSGDYGWFAYKAVIDYELNGGTLDCDSKTVDITSQGYTLTTSDIPSTPAKQYYNFINWTLNDSDPIGQTIYNGVMLVANYKPIDYSIEYHDIEKNMESSGYSTTWNNPNSFNYETSLQLSDPVREDLVFAGWFADSDLSVRVTMLDGNALVKYLDGNNVLNLYASWYSSGTASYKITYDNSDSNGAICQDKEIIVATEGFDWSSITLPDMTSNDNDYQVSTYFDGWYNGTTKITSITGDLFDENNELNLKAVYKDKVTLNIQYAGTILKTVYYKSGYSLTIPDLESYSQITISSGYVYIGWVLSDGTTKEYYKSGDVVTLTNQTILEPDIRQYVKVNVKSDTWIKANISLIENGGYVVEINEYDEITLKQFGSKAFGDSDGDSKKFSGTSNTFLVTIGSKFKVYYTLEGDESLIHDIVTTITGTTPTTALNKGESDSSTYEVVSEVTIEVTCERDSSSGGCIAQGTLITLADGTKKKVEDITSNDTLLVFNHETGKYDFAKVNFVDSEPYDYYTIINLKFSNGNCVKVISEHGFFDLNLMRYVYIDEFNYKDYIGHKFYSATWDGTIYQSNVVTLDEAYITNEYTRCYSPITMYHMNYFTEDVLSMPGGISGLFNIFEYDSDLKYNSEKMQADIEKYGLFTYDDFKDEVPYDVYLAFPAQYFKVAIGKGILTEEQLLSYIKRYLPLMI